MKVNVKRIHSRLEEIYQCGKEEDRVDRVRDLVPPPGDEHRPGDRTEHERRVEEERLQGVGCREPRRRHEHRDDRRPCRVVDAEARRLRRDERIQQPQLVDVQPRLQREQRCDEPQPGRRRERDRPPVVDVDERAPVEPRGDERHERRDAEAADRERRAREVVDLEADGDGRIRSHLRDPESGLHVAMWQASGVLQVYTGDTLDGDAARRAVALEPMQAMTDAFNRPDCAAAVTLAPGEARTFRCGLEVHVR